MAEREERPRNAPLRTVRPFNTGAIMRKSFQPQYKVRNTPAESYGRIARCTSVATPVLLAPARFSANESDVASREALDASARRAQAANGFGDAGRLTAADAGPGDASGRAHRSGEAVARRTALQLEAAARLDRSQRVAELAIALRHKFSESLRGGVIPPRQGREAAGAERTTVRAAIVFAPGDSPLLHKTAGMRELAADVTQTLAAVSRRFYGAWHRRQQAWATYRALRRLDARTLRDIGLDRSELPSIAAEVSGALEVTRMHAVHVERSY
jgi:uncharacterized protein YjiS (DUF1127 family)